MNIVALFIYILGYLVSIFGCHLVVRLLLNRYRNDIPDGGLKRAGALIGCLERILVFTLILMQQYAGISIVFAAKSIARFENLKDRKFAEYYLIGTLSSIISSMFIGILAKWLIATIA